MGENKTRSVSPKDGMTSTERAIVHAEKMAQLQEMKRQMIAAMNGRAPRVPVEAEKITGVWTDEWAKDADLAVLETKILTELEARKRLEAGVQASFPPPTADPGLLKSLNQAVTKAHTGTMSQVFGGPVGGSMQAAVQPLPASNPNPYNSMFERVLVAQREPFPYQIDGAKHLAEKPYAALVDDPGLGKTYQTLMALGNVRAFRALVVCPAIAIQAWKREASALNIPVFQVTGNYTAAMLLASGLYLLTYDMLGAERNTNLRTALCLCATWDAVIADEAHYLKNAEALRTQHFYGFHPGKMGLVSNASRVWLLSGTLAPNHIGELYPHLLRLWSPILNEVLQSLQQPITQRYTQQDFEDVVCTVREYTANGRKIRTVTGSKPEARKLLADHLRAVSLRRRKEDVLEDLPEIRITDEPLDTPETEVPDFFRNLPDCRDDNTLVVSLGQVSGRQYITDTSEHAASARRLLGERKVAAASVWIKEFLDSAPGKKLIVFAYHKDVIEALHAMGPPKSVFIHGGCSQGAREDAVNKFQNDPECRLFVGQIQAAGTAITLTAASDVVILEPSWVPAENYQAICRAHRIGQRHGVHARFLYIPNSMDEKIMRAFRRKAEQLSGLF